MKIKDLTNYFNPQQEVVSIFVDDDIKQALNEINGEEKDYSKEFIEECCEVCTEAMSDCEALINILRHYLEQKECFREEN